jgi:hypothetical protein
MELVADPVQQTHALWECTVQDALQPMTADAYNAHLFQRTPFSFRMGTLTGVTGLAKKDFLRRIKFAVLVAIVHAVSELIR